MRKCERGNSIPNCWQSFEVIDCLLLCACVSLGTERETPCRKLLIILLALCGGILLGVVAGTRFTEAADVIGTLWLNGLRMTVVPLVVALLITGIALTADAARAGRLPGEQC